MAKEKDPAFLFYSKDWIEGTAKFMPNEKGVFIDLLAHQHQKTGLPTDMNRLARLVGLSISEFTEIWNVISEKFTEVDGRYFNNRLLKVMNERGEKGKKNTIIGIFSGILRKEKPTKKEYIFIKNSFNADDFMQFDNERLSERINEWYKERLKSIENEDGNGYEDENKNVDEILSAEFQIFWNLYDKKVGDKEKVFKKWSKLKPEEKEQILIHVPKYTLSTPVKKFRLNPETYINNKGWNNEIIFTKKENTMTEVINPDKYANPNDNKYGIKVL